MNVVDELFKLLDTWRHLPSYQLERRADIFFAPYISDLMLELYATSPTLVIPEFPIRIGTIYPNIDINKSYKADYLVILKKLNRCVLIELKTDDKSRRLKQDDYLSAAKSVGFMALLEGVVMISKATSSKLKYGVLIESLVGSGLLVKEEIEFQVSSNANLDINILYIQPNPKVPSDQYISFSRFADLVGKHPDGFSIRFAQSLREWANVSAGESVLDA
jgi:hypothetical protein